MKRRGGAPSSCSSSTSSSSCIGPTDNISTKKPKRLRPKKIQSHHSLATSPKSRSSIYRGVTRHRWTGRFEAHLWDKTTWNNIQNKRGRQIYLGAYDNEEDAGRTYDLAALKYWGPLAILNFPVESYDKEIEEMEKMSREEYLASLRRRSSGFSRGVSKYRGVARHHHNGRWEARIGRISGNKYLYLGTYSTQEEAAAAYDRAAIQYRGPKAVTNFDISNYTDKLDDIVPKFEVTKQEDVQEKEKPNPKSPDNVQVDEASDDHHRVENLKMDQPGRMTYPMDPTEDHIEPPWDLCLDVGFNSLALPDIPLEKASELLGWLDHNVFKDDDIEFIFDYENDLAQEDAMSGTCECKADASVNAVDLKGQELSTSHSSSSLSTMASVGSNI